MLWYVRSPKWSCGCTHKRDQQENLYSCMESVSVTLQKRISFCLSKGQLFLRHCYCCSTTPHLMNIYLKNKINKKKNQTEKKPKTKVSPAGLDLIGTDLFSNELFLLLCPSSSMLQDAALALLLMGPSNLSTWTILKNIVDNCHNSHLPQLLRNYLEIIIKNAEFWRGLVMSE